MREIEEIWKDIPWYIDRYQVSNMWNVKSIGRGKIRILKGSDDTWGYRGIRINNWFWYKNWKIHRLVMLAFKWPANWLEVNHKNWIKNDNKLNNLEYVTRSENLLHRYKVLGQKWAWTWKFWKLHHWAKKIEQYTLEWKYIQTWECSADAERETNICARNIRNVCNWKRNRAWPFIWRFA